MPLSVAGHRVVESWDLASFIFSKDALIDRSIGLRALYGGGRIRNCFFGSSAINIKI